MEYIKIKYIGQDSPKFAYYGDLLKEEVKRPVHSSFYDLEDYFYTKKASVKKETTLEDQIGSFAVIIDDITNANILLGIAQDKGLTIKSNNHFWSRTGVENARIGDILLFFVGKTHDITWTNNAEYSISQNIRPVLTTGKNPSEIEDRILKAGKEKKQLLTAKLPKERIYRELKAMEVAKKIREAEAKKVDVKPTYNTTERVRVKFIEECPNFIQIGTKIYPKNPNDHISRIICL
jgi:hypothetical protein